MKILTVSGAKAVTLAVLLMTGATAVLSAQNIKITGTVSDDENNPLIAAAVIVVPAEIEPYADALLLTFGVSNQAVLEIINGTYEPYALLPCQLPADMETVEAQCEDVPKDMRPYVDKDGNCYNFAFGMNWSGVINDSRVKRYE